MALNTKKIPSKQKSNRVEQPTLEAGSYPARVVQIIDLGLQPQRAYDNQKKPPAYEIFVIYELVDVFIVDEEGKELEDKPRWVNESFPIYSLDADLAKSTKRYKALDPDIVFDGDFSKLLGTPCTVTLAINKKGDKEYENVVNVSTMRPKDAARCPELQNEARFFDLEEPNIEVFNKLPKWLQEKIISNLEYKGSKLESMLEETSEEQEEEEAPKQRKKAAPKKEEPAAWEDDSEEDDVPY